MKIKRVIIDTNVFVSGIFWSGPPYQILKAWSEKRLELIISLEILEEYNRVFEILGKKYPPINLTNFGELITQEAYFFEPVKLFEQISSDPDDDKFIACALAAQVDCIVSGDRDLLVVDGFNGVRVIAPGKFIKEYF
ncbi:MAG: putative toxin-antitoxin system toxin component, PIN family [Gammaproteobacteria bacterium]|nr:MAG: putative toxin-antitoxin system toxin component, PIN family [Gammaproteobacteria bacterium]